MPCYRCQHKNLFLIKTNVSLFNQLVSIPNFVLLKKSRFCLQKSDLYVPVLFTMVSRRITIVILLLVINSILFVNGGKKSKDGEKPAWAKKDIRDYSEADLERLLDQWDVCIF